jgi:SAM-dependent methyltransferase
VDYDPAAYGDTWAEIYDEWVETVGHVPTPEVIVPVLAELAGAGPALELAIGTGRVALPLAEAGVEVHGIDASEAMVERLRAKPGGQALTVTRGDMAEVPVEGRYPLIYLVFNTLFALLSQEDQVRCFTNVARHLTDEGVFVIEAFVPDVSRFDRGQRVQTANIGPDLVDLEVSKHDPVDQRVDSMKVLIGQDGTRLFPVQIRYAWPAELDLMARLAGLRLRERWGGWGREPFSSSSPQHVSLFERDPAHSSD